MSLPTVAVQPATASAAAGVGAPGLAQAVLGMAIVLGLILLCAWMARRFGLQRPGGGGQQVKVISSTPVGQRERVVVVEIGGNWLVLGVTAQQISALHTLPAQTAQSTTSTPPGRTAPPLANAFSQLLRQSLTGKPRPLP